MKLLKTQAKIIHNNIMIEYNSVLPVVKVPWVSPQYFADPEL
jgi:hypothetical protein